MKTHYYYAKTVMFTPTYKKVIYKRKEIDGAMCGYVRKVTDDISKVTCLLCINELKKGKKQ